MRHFKLFLFSLVVGLFCCSIYVSAAEYVLLIDGDNTMASEDGNVPPNAGVPRKMTDGSGMNGNGDNADRSLLRWPYDYSPGHPSTWTNTSTSYSAEFQATKQLSSAENSKIGWITFDLGGVYELADLYFWNGYEGGDRGISNFNVYIATDALNIPSAWDQDYVFDAGNGWTQYGDDDSNRATPRYTLPESTSIPTLYELTIPITNNATARYIGIEVMSTWGSTDRFGLAEFAVIVVDTNAPTLAASDITDDAGGSVGVYNPVTYTLTFSEEMNTYSVTSGVFSAASSSGFDVDYITQTATNVFEVIVTPTNTGSLLLRVSSNVTDWAGLNLASNVDDANTITVGADSSAPQTISHTNDRNGGPIAINTPITYTVTFDEYMDATSITTADFVNGAASPASISVDSVTQGYLPSIFVVVVTPTGVGDIQLRIPIGAVKNASNIPNDADLDDTVTIEVNDPGLVIYEPFDDPDSTLSGNTPGIGLTNTWAASASVLAGSLTHGELVTSSNRVFFDGQYGTISHGSTLSSLGLLNDGATLWFSFLVKIGQFGTNPDSGFALATGNIGTVNGIPISSSGTGMGVRFKNGFSAAYWSSNPTTGATGSGSAGTTYLIAGKFDWGATNDTVTIYNVSSNLTLDSAISTYSADADQSQFSKITFGGKGDGPGNEIDEIRFGSTFDSVIVLPPPAGTMIMVK